MGTLTLPRSAVTGMLVLIVLLACQCSAPPVPPAMTATPIVPQPVTATATMGSYPTGEVTAVPTHTAVPTATPTHTTVPPTPSPTLEPTATATLVATLVSPPTATMIPTAVPTIEPLDTYTVQRGDWLIKIAIHLYGGRYGWQWKCLHANNRAVIGDDPNLIYRGQVLRGIRGCGGVRP